MLDATLVEKWIKKETKVSFLGKRRYAHFDSKFMFDKKKESLLNYYLLPENVAVHSFYPFIKSDIKTKRYANTGEFDENGKPIRISDYKIRPIAYASHIDSAIYSWYSTMLTDAYEKKIRDYDIEKCVLAYIEKGECNIEFAHRVFQQIKERGECVALTFDIKSFFDNLDHEHLKKMWCKLLDANWLQEDHYNVFWSLTSYDYVETDVLNSIFPELEQKKKKRIYINRICTQEEFAYKVRKSTVITKNPFKNNIQGSKRHGNSCGIPQGSPISACLSNVYMIDFDILLNSWVKTIGGVYYRYSDDIIMLVDALNKKNAIEKIENTLKLFELEANPKKTEVTIFKLDFKGDLRAFKDKMGNVYSNLQYLGFEFNGQNAYIRSSSMSKFHRRVSAGVRKTLKSAYGKKSRGNKIFKKKLYKRFTDKGKRNFLAYAKRASKHMDSRTILKQHNGSIEKVFKKLNDKNAELAKKKRLPIIK